MKRASSRGGVRGTRVLLILGFVFFSLQGVQALAQSGFDAQQFNPMPAQTVNFFGLASARVLGHGQFDVGVLANYAAGPLVIKSPDGDDMVSLVDSQLTVDVMGAFGLFGLFDLGVDVPLVLLQEGDSTDLVHDAPDASFGLGDIRAVPRFLIYTNQTLDDPSGIAVGILGNVFIPVGNQDNFQGEGGVRVEPRVTFDVAYRDLLKVGLNAGYMVRPENQFANVSIDDTLTYGLALSYHLPLPLYLIAELSGETSILADEINMEESPLEALLGLKYMPVDGLLIEAGGGLGLNEGFGNPAWRAILGVGYGPSLDADLDDDGYLDDADGCPERAEDFDGFEDENGCPDEDNDGDGVLDVADRCPDDAEDFDGFEDEDGCPDEDNDQDTVLDKDDQCPNDAEDLDGFEDRDGCPDPDNDNDGFPDATDICPDNAESVNNFEDEDGCPDAQVELIQCEEIEIYEAIAFEMDSDVVLESSYPILDQIASLLQFRRDIQQLEIAAHVDTIMGSDMDFNLSLMRAEEIRRLLIERGVGWTRLVPEAYGDTRPVGDSATPEGRAANTRIEFIIRQQDGCD